MSLFNRTPEASERASEFINSHLESIVRELLRLNGFYPQQASAGRFNFQQDSLASMLTLNAVTDALLLKDLNYHIIKNETQLEFYISDHPVFIYNWFYRNLEHPQITSLTAVGLQIFLPLSPKITFCLYDPKVYKYGNRKSLIYNIENKDDIEILNSFQMINSYSIIGFSSRESEVSVKQLHRRYKNIKLHQYESGILSTEVESKTRRKSRHSVYRQQTKLKRMPSFIKIKNNYKKDASYYKERSPDLSAKHAEFKRLIDDKIKRSIIEL